MAKKTPKKEKYISYRTRNNRNAYEINITLNGQKYSKYINIADFDSPSDALDFARQLRDEALTKMRSGYTVSKFPTVGQLYEKSYEVFPQRVKTRQRHDIFYKYGISEYADVPINKITSADIQISVNKYGKTHTREQTIHFMAVWHRIYKTAAMLNVVVPDRTVPVVIGECKKAKPRSKEISMEDLEKFCDALLEYNKASITGSYMTHAIYYGIQIMLYCGFRPAETFALMKQDINLVAGTISIDKAVRSSQDSLLTIGTTKTERSVRTVPIPEQLRPILIECLNWSKHDILLADFHGNLMDIRDIDTLIRNCRKKIGIDFTLYQLRHRFSTDLLNSGTNPAIVRDLMGHSSQTMSLDYATTSEESRADAIKNRKLS